MHGFLPVKNCVYAFVNVVVNRFSLTISRKNQLLSLGEGEEPNYVTLLLYVYHNPNKLLDMHRSGYEVWGVGGAGEEMR